jgi:predicted DNA-binding transcriptional regulator YafY
MHRTECFYRIDRLLTERRGVTMAVLIDADGSYLLELPYSAAHELVMDILRHGPEVEVLSPARLRTQVREQLAAALRRYAE